jgi:excisionase family DNA binding protein
MSTDLSKQNRGGQNGDATARLTVRIKEACRMTGIGRSKLYQLISDGEIEIVKVGAMTLVPVAGLQRFLEGKKERQ